MPMPVLKIEAETIAEAWERAVLEVWNNGVNKATQYERAGEHALQQSRAATVVVVAKNPLKEPRIHAGDLTGQQSIINGYIDELVKGTKDSYIGRGWDYTYHERLFRYYVPQSGSIDQIRECLLEGMRKGDHFSRRLQAVTWQAWKDAGSKSPPCLQRLWISVPTADSALQPGRTYGIDVQTCWRSRDLFDAWEANVNGIVELVREEIVEVLNEELRSKGITYELGQYVDFSNDLHIYEKDYVDVRRFISALESKRSLGRTPEQIRIGPTFERLIEIGRSRRVDRS